MNDTNLEELAARSAAGDKIALETLVQKIQSQVYGLAVRMLWHPQEAEDASQEILVRVVTHVGTFRGESAFSTWVYRIAANYLLRARKSRAERAEMSFEEFGDDLDENLVETEDPTNPDKMFFDLQNYMRMPKGRSIPRAPHERWKHAEQSLGLVLDQDAYNLPRVQKGMHSAGYRGLHIANQERRIRHMHQTLDSYLDA